MPVSDGPWCRLLQATTQVWWRDQPVDLGGRQHRRVLTGLLLEPAAVVTVTRLVELVWGDAPPRSAGKSLQVLISHLRRSLRHCGCRIGTEATGYRVEIEATRIDLHRFRNLVGRARLAGDPHRRVDLLSEALSLFAGEPLADLAGTDPGDRVRARVGGEYLAALEERFESQLDTGQAGELVPELTEMVAAHPTSEGPPALLMRALRAAGRPADALAVYATVRSVLAEQLGAEPGPALRRIHAALLTDTGHGQAQPTVAPRQLPAAVVGFAGRSAELATLTCQSEHAHPRTVSVISVISGTAGVGKTALAIHWAHQVADRYPDGQLYVNLRGFGPSGTPMTAAEAVRGFLDALEVPAGRIPTSLDAQMGLYRSLTAGRRMLIVLDNARDGQQVRPLLPGAGCLTLVTSRNWMTGLVASHGAHLLRLDPLPTGEARDMLTRRLGPQRAHAEPDAVAELVELCARLPLALAITAARAAQHPGNSLATFTAELRDAQSRLDVLDVGDVATDVGAVFSWSYRNLTSAAARMFRHLGLHPGPYISVAAAASTAHLPWQEAYRALTELSRASLLIEQPSDRFASHDLLRAYAAGLARGCDGDDQCRAALHRVLDHYVHTAQGADRWLNPHRDQVTLPAPRPGVTVTEFTGPGEAIAWLTTERPVLLAAIERASRSGFDTHACHLAWRIATFLDRRGRWDDEVTSQHHALAAARRLGDQSVQERVHRTLAHAYGRLQRHDDAYAHVQRALEISTELGDDVGQAHAYLRMAWLRDDEGRPADTIDAAQRALHLFRKVDDRSGQADSLNLIGWCHALLGRYRKTIAYCRDALLLHQQIGNVRGAAATLDSLGYSHHHLGDHRQAIDHYQQALHLYARVGGSPNDEAEILTHLGDAHQAAGDRAPAREAWRRALAIFAELDQSDHPEAQRVRAELDRTHEPNPAPNRD